MDDADASEVAKALSHPLRIEYLRALASRRLLSPSDFAGEYEKPLGNVAYHVKTLHASGVVEVAETVPKRGALEHRYSFTGHNAPAVISLMALLAAL